MRTIAFDFDGVLANTNILKHKWIYNYLNILLSDVDKISIFRKLSQKYSKEKINEIYKKMSSYVFTRENLLKSDMMDKNIPFYLDEFGKKYRLIIITNRPQFMLEWIKEWLEKNNILKYFDSVLSSTYNTKGNIAKEENVSILIDDDIRHLSDNNIEYNILFNSGDIKNWQQLYEYINKIDNEINNNPKLIKTK